jgi:hypothetical protein
MDVVRFSIIIFSSKPPRLIPIVFQRLRHGFTPKKGATDGQAKEAS